jgi:putative endonuclease
MPKVFTSKAQKIGELGEDIACIYLKKLGFTVLERNYYKLIGEIDIVAEKQGTLHFIEVKSASCLPDSVSGETLENKSLLTIKPEDNFTFDKIHKFKKIISFYMADKYVSHETEVQIDLLALYIDKNTKKAHIKPFWNIIL